MLALSAADELGVDMAEGVEPPPDEHAFKATAQATANMVCKDNLLTVYSLLLEV